MLVHTGCSWAQHRTEAGCIIAVRNIKSAHGDKRSFDTDQLLTSSAVTERTHENGEKD